MAASGIVSKTRSEEKCPGFCFLSSYWFPAYTSLGQIQTETYWCENMIVMISMEDGPPQAHVFKNVAPGWWHCLERLWDL